MEYVITQPFQKSDHPTAVHVGWITLFGLMRDCSLCRQNFGLKNPKIAWIKPKMCLVVWNSNMGCAQIVKTTGLNGTIIFKRKGNASQVVQCY